MKQCLMPLQGLEVDKYLQEGRYSLLYHSLEDPAVVHYNCAFLMGKVAPGIKGKGL